MAMIEAEINKAVVRNKEIMKEQAKIQAQKESISPFFSLSNTTKNISLYTQTALITSVIVGYLGCNYIIMKLNTKLLHPHAWSFWMDHLSIEYIQEHSDTFAPQLISHIIDFYAAQNKKEYTTINEDQHYKQCVQYISTFFIDIDREVALLTIYQKIASAIHKIPGHTYLFCIEPVIINTIQNRIQRLNIYKQLCVEALQKPINPTMQGA